ncbi:nucleoside/nucleotide kinase family protein [Herbiconiux daphne]|uniref:ATP-binding protein n=1 Tax=Herbiconiux daphne TaxID=2970914 RepID=A0ABT2H0E7_9MICO|nr:ATP-binding protein [Herbiconiux daphne]MCS5733076.1 ATP-binding protein [Herbiconiux daphne]
MTVILIDGPSGSGKTDLASRLRDGWVGDDRPTVVHLDDIYPGWDGLDAASEAVTEHLLLPLRAGRPGRWRRHDWQTGRPAEWHGVDPRHPLVIEGCGALSRANAALADLSIWVEADDAVRKARALQRDGELYAREWDRWEAQWQRFVRRESPRQLALLVVPT